MKTNRRILPLLKRPSLFHRNIRLFTEQKELDKPIDGPVFKTIFSNGTFIPDGLHTKRWLGQKAGLFFLATLFSYKFIALPVWMATIYFASDAMAKRMALARILKTSITKLEITNAKPKMVRMFIGPYNFQLITKANNIRTPIRKDVFTERCDEFVVNPEASTLDFYVLVKDPVECEFTENLNFIDKSYLVVSYSKERNDSIDLDEMVKLLGK